MQSLVEYVLEGETRPRESNPAELQWIGEATDVQLDEFLQILLDANLDAKHDPKRLPLHGWRCLVRCRTGQPGADLRPRRSQRFIQLEVI